MPRLRRRWIVLLAVLAVALLVGGYALDALLEAAIRGPVNAYLRARTLELVRSAKAEGLEIAVPRANVHILRRMVVLEGIRIRFADGDEGGRRILEASTPRVRLTGVVLWDIVRGRAFRVDGAEITRPVVLLEEVAGAKQDSAAAENGDSTSTAKGADLPSPDSLLFHTVQSWLPEEMHDSRIAELRVEDGIVAYRSVGDRGRTLDSVAGIALRLTGLSVDSARERVFERARLGAERFIHAGPDPADSILGEELRLEITADDTVLSLARIRTAALPGHHLARLTGFRRSQAGRSVSADTVAWEPHEPDSVFFRTAPPRSTRVRAVASGVTVMGLPPESVRRRRLVAGGAWIRSLQVDVLADRRPEGKPPRRVLWPARFAELGWVAGADSVILENARIRYAELLPKAERAGEVRFEELRAKVTNATNDPERTREPLVIQAEGLLYGEAPLSARIAVPVKPGPFEATVTGEAGTMPLPTFNRFLHPADGFQITGGTLHQAHFRFTVRNGEARGRLEAAWEGLGLRKANKSTGKQSLGDKIVTLFANAVTRESNLPNRDGKLEPERIRYEVNPTDTFWGLLWRALRSGIVAAVRE
jgi:hypothetical protein